MYQFNDLFKAVGFLLLIFLSGIAFQKCDNQKKANAQIKILDQTKSYEKKIIAIDSTINRIPFTFDDSTRTKFLQNYTKFR